MPDKYLLWSCFGYSITYPQTWSYAVPLASASHVPLRFVSQCGNKRESKREQRFNREQRLATHGTTQSKNGYLQSQIPQILSVEILTSQHS